MMMANIHLVDKSSSMQSLQHLAGRAAATDVSVILLGETGVGKNRWAEWIHAHSPRSNRPFISVNCAAIPASLMESELFGYEAGAFTGAIRGGKPGRVESANEGTLFLDEIGELPVELQGKLLDFIQQKTLMRVGGTQSIYINARIICATNRDLAQMVGEGTFRSDLYYRLNVVPLEIPALRDRSEDIPELVRTFQARLDQDYPHLSKQFSPEVIRIFQGYNWPGNIRELEHLIERLTVMVEEDTILPIHLPIELRGSTPFPKHPNTPSTFSAAAQISPLVKAESPLKMLDILEKSIYEDALRAYRTTYDIALALQVSQPTVVRKIKHYGLRGSATMSDG